MCVYMRERESIWLVNMCLPGGLQMCLRVSLEQEKTKECRGSCRVGSLAHLYAAGSRGLGTPLCREVSIPRRWRQRLQKAFSPSILSGPNWTGGESEVGQPHHQLLAELDLEPSQSPGLGFFWSTECLGDSIWVPSWLTGRTDTDHWCASGAHLGVNILTYFSFLV